jgi:hypothetical protein
MLVEAYRNPQALMQLLEQTPGYQFALQQGRRREGRRGASAGYYRSPRLDFELDNFQTGLAQRTWDQEIRRIMEMAGVGISPSNASQMMAQQGTNTAEGNANYWNNIIAGAGSFMQSPIGQQFGSWLGGLIG